MSGYVVKVENFIKKLGTLLIEKAQVLKPTVADIIFCKIFKVPNILKGLTFCEETNINNTFL